jgi:DNA polymerase-3 subunit alpha
MKKQHDMFINGCVKNGMSKKNAENLWIQFEPFAGYGFGKAHAACYATIAFRTAYLKAHYPVEFMTALLTAESRGSSGPVKDEKTAQAIAECRRLNLSVLPPDINKSTDEFSIEDHTKIRFGLSAVKNVGIAAIKTIIAARKHGVFKSLEDLCTRVDLGAVNKKTVESLIKTGAMDSFGNRASLLISYPDIVEKVSKKQKADSKGQTSLFGDHNFDDHQKALKPVEDFTEAEKLGFEKEFLGLYLTSHPQMHNLTSLKGKITHLIDTLPEELEGSTVIIGGLIENIKKIYTKRGNNEMAFITLGDEKGLTVECVIFPKIFDRFKSILVRESVIIVNGRLDIKNEKPIIIAERISLVG